MGANNQTPKTIFQFRSRNYVLVEDQNSVSIVDQHSLVSVTKLKGTLQTTKTTIERAKKKLERVLLKTPDPGMTFSD